MKWWKSQKKCGHSFDVAFVVGLGVLSPSNQIKCVPKENFIVTKTGIRRHLVFFCFISFRLKLYICYASASFVYTSVRVSYVLLMYLLKWNAWISANFMLTFPHFSSGFLVHFHEIFNYYSVFKNYWWKNHTLSVCFILQLNDIFVVDMPWFLGRA